LGAPHPVGPTTDGYRAIPGHLPNYRAFFQIGLADGRSVQTAERILPLEGPANFRDLGGYPAANGQRVAWGRVYRSDELHVLTPGDEAFLRDLGIRLICDLRSHAEVARRPDRVPRGIAYVHIPVYAREPFGQARVVLSRHRLDALLDRLYRAAIIDRGAAALGQALRMAADPANLPLVFHCTGGKDRAGVISALLLHICGVPRATIVADYSLTNLAAGRFLASIREAVRGSRPVPGFRVEQLYPLLSARPALIERALAIVDERYGSLDAYLRGPAELSMGEIEAIRRSLLA
jgi:protein-tyrosine phosphatase